MKFLKKSLIVLVVLSLVFNIFTFVTSAANSATIYFSENTVKVDDKVTVTVKINPNKKMYAVNFYLEYNDEVLKYENGVGVGDAGVLQVVEALSGEESISFSFVFSAKTVGTSAVAVTDCIYATTEEGKTKEVEFAGASAKMTVKDPELSSNAKLKSLKISGVTLSPKFKSSTTSYKAKVPYETEKLSVSATPEEKSAKVVSVKGDTDLEVGKNTVTVTVEAENGTQKKYTIKVTREEKEEDEPEEEDKEDKTEDEEKTEDEDEEETDDEEVDTLETTVDGTPFSIVTKIPEEILFKGFSIEETQVNGYTVETAVDNDKNYRIFYLQAADSEELIPYLYDADLDEFERLKFITINDNYYIFSQIPQDMKYPETLYPSSVSIGGFTVDCLSDSNTDFSDFQYIYCFSNGIYNLYRYDSVEGTLQRYPDFKFEAFEEETKNDNLISRFSALSTNGKVIIIALLVVILGIFALLVLLIVNLIKKSIGRDDDLVLSSDFDDFDDVEVKGNSMPLE